MIIMIMIYFVQKTQYTVNNTFGKCIGHFRYIRYNNGDNKIKMIQMNHRTVGRILLPLDNKNETLALFFNFT
jgi:hypothetical protein